MLRMLLVLMSVVALAKVSHAVMNVLVAEPRYVKSGFKVRLDVHKRNGSWVIQDSGGFLSSQAKSVNKKVKVFWPLYQNRQSFGVVIRNQKTDQFELQTTSPVVPDYSERIILEWDLEGSSVLAVPISSVMSPMGQKPYVYVVDAENKIQSTFVYVLGIESEQLVLLAKDLNIKSLVVATGAHRVLPGANVNPIKIQANQISESEKP